MLQKFINRISAFINTRKYRRQAKVLDAIRKESKRVVQIREFNSELYISYHDIPLINVRYLQDTQRVLADARNTREEYISSDVIK